MHLLATTGGEIGGGGAAVDLAQTPGEVVVISAADSELAALASAHDRAGNRLSLRLAPLMQLTHNLSVDLYVEKTLRHAKLIVLRLLGGESYWSYGLSELAALARARGILFVALPGDAGRDPPLAARSTVALADAERLHGYLKEGGAENHDRFLRFCAALLDGGQRPPPAAALATCGVYRRTGVADGPQALILFYRALMEGGSTQPVDALLDALAGRGMRATAIYVSSLKDPACEAILSQAAGAPDVILNATAFAVASGGGADPLARFDCPVLQTVFACSDEAAWRESSQGLGPRDLAMSVVMPELDGRIHARAVSFKAEALLHAPTQCRILAYRPVADRVAFVAGLAAAWVRLRRVQVGERRVGIVLANYPNRDGRIANGVGYDTPASTIAILQALRADGYEAGPLPVSGNALIEALQAGPTNAVRRPGGVRLTLVTYRQHFDALPEAVRAAVTARWGEPDRDSFFADGGFHLPVKLYGNAVVAIQPARGYNIDPKTTYHDPALVPPHGYFAFYIWLRHVYGAHAVIHNGKHGTLEWLPGKATALSADCYPEAVLGPLPQLYPFIVNDPGEGTQAKRRSSAVIVDHLTPPLTRAESYGPLKDLEALIDEYYLAQGMDRRRLAALRKSILDLTRSARLDLDAGFTGEEDEDLKRLDAFICDMKEAQIRDGLHVLGSSPTGRQEVDTLVALARVPRGLGEGGDASLIRALAADLGLVGFDPLGCEMAEPWTGPRPVELLAVSDDPWRTFGDTVERLELLAQSLIATSLPSSRRKPGPNPPHGQTERSLPEQPWVPAFAGMTTGVMTHLKTTLLPALRASGPAEIAAVLSGLAGRRIAPGPSGAPTRGRTDVLPTGRNFYSLDTRAVPTPTAWNLGKASAEALLTRHLQDTGAYPKCLGLSVWGTSNMRTGGDDIAQALALIGARPVWEPSSWRVTGYELLPMAALGRPRVDVTLRISGFFRDAFPAQIELLDRAMRAAGGLEEDADDNPIAQRMREDAAALAHSGMAQVDARTLAGHRIFGSKPGAYGAGLQALIDEKLWSDRGDFAAAYVTWGAYAYGGGTAGGFAPEQFRARLQRIEAVVHNQDNREHDLLDSDDYYQFEGGMSAAAEQASGRKPRAYHNDHSRPERPVIRTLEEEVSRVMRSRVANPKWIAGVKRHGYKGAFEIAATVDYMFAFAATTGAVKTHHFDLAFEAYLADEETRGFIALNNPAALKEIAERFAEACARGLWTPRVNSAHELLRELAA